jgi:hypothetical protein
MNLDQRTAVAAIEFGSEGAHRVLLHQALSDDEFLRVTWHEHNDVFVFSQWQGDTCVATTPVSVEELGDLASMRVSALSHRAKQPVPEQSSWPAPDRSTAVLAYWAQSA